MTRRQSVIPTLSNKAGRSEQSENMVEVEVSHSPEAARHLQSALKGTYCSLRPKPNEVAPLQNTEEMQSFSP